MCQLCKVKHHFIVWINLCWNWKRTAQSSQKAKNIPNTHNLLPGRLQASGSVVYLSSVWHEHAVLASDSPGVALRPEVTTDLSYCEFFQFWYMFVWRCPPKRPQAPQCGFGHFAACLPESLPLHAERYTIYERLTRSMLPWDSHATKLNCCMTTPPLERWRDFHLLSGMNHF